MYVYNERQETIDSCLISGRTYALTRGIMFHWKLQRKPSIAVSRLKKISFWFILSWQIFTNSLNKLGQLPTKIFWLSPDLYLGTTRDVMGFSSVDCWRNVWTNKLILIKNKVRLMPTSFSPTQRLIKIQNPDIWVLHRRR